MRVLVAIAHHGSKNRQFLLRMLDAFRAMEHRVDVVALCEAPKELPADVEQVIGLPSEDPWSLPFAHRQLFADRRDDYDLFVYSEDDTLIEQRHLDTFVELQRDLPDHLLPGFMRFEVDGAGRRSYCTVHSFYRWDPASVFRHGERTFARFTNDHSACYVLTRQQLHRAIASGGFLVAPHAGRYDMLVSAATDVYTSCGFQKVLCVERLDDQLVHHMPNVYLGKLGIDEAMFRSQLDELRQLPAGPQPQPQLVVPETQLATRVWDRHSYPRPPAALPELLPSRRSRVLSVGATSGDLEARVIDLGHEVLAVPTDRIFARTLEDRGIDALAPRLPSEDDLRSVGPFDLVLAPDLLPYLPDPVRALRTLAAALADDGQLLATVPDHRRYAARNTIRRRDRVELPAAYGTDGVHRVDGRRLRGWLAAAGYTIEELRHRAATRNEPFGTGGLRSRLLGNTLAVRARPAPSRTGARR